MACLLFQPHPHKKKIPAECWRAKKIICKRILEKKKFIVNQGVKKKNFTTRPNHPPPPPPSEVEWSAPKYCSSLCYLPSVHCLQQMKFKY